MLQCEHIADENFRIAVDLNDIRDLDHRVAFGGREFARGGRALDVEGKDTERCNFGVLAFARQTLYLVEVLNVKLNLTNCLLIGSGADLPMFALNFNPSHPANFVVDHESQRVRHVALVGNFT